MQAQYRPYAPGAQQVQLPQRVPHMANQRRGGGMAVQGAAHPTGPHVAPGSMSQPSVVPHDPQNRALQSELVKRKTRKPTDKSMPDGVEDSVIDGDVVQRYKELRDIERRLDAAMTRKRLDMADAVSRNPKRFKTLRVWISNTVEDQIWQGNGLSVDTFDFTPNMEASYRVKIEGRLLEDGTDISQDGEASNASASAGGEDSMEDDGPSNSTSKTPNTTPQKYPFSHFFKALTVEFDKSRVAIGSEQSVEWKKPENKAQQPSNLPAEGDFDELTFKRNGDENMNISINLYRQEDPERFQLSPELADIVDATEATRQEVVMGVWEYIKAMGLQEDEEKRNFRCDALLKKVINSGEIGGIPNLNEYLAPHLTPLPPISLPYTIRVDEDFHKDPQPTIYDIRVAVDDPLRLKSRPFGYNASYASALKEVAALDEQLSTIIAAITSSKAKHSFFTSLSVDPANFVRKWLSSQKRDLEVIVGEATRGGGEDATGDEWRKGGKNSVWATPNARESVNVMLAKQPTQAAR